MTSSGSPVNPTSLWRTFSSDINQSISSASWLFSTPCIQNQSVLKSNEIPLVQFSFHIQLYYTVPVCASSARGMPGGLCSSMLYFVYPLENNFNAQFKQFECLSQTNFPQTFQLKQLSSQTILCYTPYKSK